jgi:hypothetical protein
MMRFRGRRRWSRPGGSRRLRGRPGTSRRGQGFTLADRASPRQQNPAAPAGAGTAGPYCRVLGLWISQHPRLPSRPSAAPRQGKSARRGPRRSVFQDGVQDETTSEAAPRCWRSAGPTRGKTVYFCRLSPPVVGGTRPGQRRRGSSSGCPGGAGAERGLTRSPRSRAVLPSGGLTRWMWS